MRLVSLGNEFCTRTDRALVDVHKLVDCILVYASDHVELLLWIRQVIERCQEWGIKLFNNKY